MKISTRELLALEDSSKVCESIIQSCNHAANETQDQQLKGLFKSIAQEHQQMVTSTTNFIKQTNLQ